MESKTKTTINVINGKKYLHKVKDKKIDNDPNAIYAKDVRVSKYHCKRCDVNLESYRCPGVIYEETNIEVLNGQLVVFGKESVWLCNRCILDVFKFIKNGKSK